LQTVKCIWDIIAFSYFLNIANIIALLFSQSIVIALAVLFINVANSPKPYLVQFHEGNWAC